MCCCCCEIQKEENLTTKKQYRHGAEHKSCCQEVNPVSRSLRQLKAELIRHDIEVEELNIKTLEFQNKELEEKFMSQWRIHKEWSVILFGTVCIIVFVIKLWFFARKEFFKAWVVPIGLVPSVMLVVLAITKPDLLKKYYDTVVCGALFFVSISLSIDNFMFRTAESVTKKDIPDCRAYFISPMVKAIVWFSALGLQTKFITSLKFGLTSSVIELILVITSIGGLANLTNFLSLCFSTGISLLYAVLHAYRTEIASRRSFLIAGEVWDTPELKEDMFDSLLHKWTAEFIDPKLQIEYRGFHRLKRTKYIRRKIVTSMFSCVVIIFVYCFVRLPLPFKSFNILRKYQSPGNSTVYYDEKTEPFSPLHTKLLNNIFLLLKTHVPLSFLAGLASVMIVAKWPKSYKKDTTKNKIISLILLFFVPVIISILWVVVIENAFDIADTHFALMVPLNDETKNLTGPEWTELLGKIDNKDPLDIAASTPNFFTNVCKMNNASGHECDFRVFEAAQTICVGGTSLRTYTVWVLQILCLILTTRRVPAFIGVTTTLLSHVICSIIFKVQQKLFQEIPLYICAYIVMANLDRVHKEHFLALRFSQDRKKRRKITQRQKTRRASRRKSRASAVRSSVVLSSQSATLNPLFGAQDIEAVTPTKIRGEVGREVI
jgi:hypothetical protein